MSARKLLQEFRALPTDHQRKFLREALASGGRRNRMTRRPRRVVWPDVEARAKQITGNRVLPNLALAERDEASF